MVVAKTAAVRCSIPARYKLSSSATSILSLDPRHHSLLSIARRIFMVPNNLRSEYDLGPAMTESTSRESNLLQGQPPTLHTTTSPEGSLPNYSRVTGSARLVETTTKHHADTASDKATAAFIRRTLCSHNVLLGNGEKGRNTPRPIEEVLPPLTSSNEVDLQLYAIISVIIKEFVQTWYSKITPDHVFVNEVIQIIAHCTRALEQRLRKVDLEALLLDEIPGLIEAHWGGR